MCGVIGLVYSADRDDLGATGGVLLRALQYRGYDSTGAATQSSTSEEVDLRKSVGAPSEIVPGLGIDQMSGQVFCGQVRWATFGAVDDLNAQPHEVRCHIHLYGAHNGNVTNTDAMQSWLRSEGHTLKSDNDGEVVVHTVEHFFAEALKEDGSDRARALRIAASRACAKLEGSFASVTVDPVSRAVVVIKRGSSLYVGIGEDEKGSFALASSDLGAVLTQTRTLLPLNAGEMVQLGAEAQHVYAVEAPDAPLERATVESELRIEDTALQEPFRSFMEQEIHAQPQTLRDLRAAFDDDVEYAGLANQLCDRIAQAVGRGGQVHVVCCGTSFHAAGAGALFFSELAKLPITPSLPGEVRARHAALFKPEDLFIAVSQSGETKDLIDVVDAARAAGVGVAAIVNNVRSTLGQEKADLVLPLRCGPEIAVPATKSFVAQLGVFYELAHRLGKRRGLDVPAKPDLAALVERTLADTSERLEEAAELLHLTPSIHILATRMLPIAKEGALKVREVVLNHTEGFEGSEFKHGPNTILGTNTVFGAAQVQSLLDAIAESGSDPRRGLSEHFGALYADYPLVYVTGPADRDVDLTISQLHTHKIRGAQTFVIAEESTRLREAAERAPMGAEGYRAVYVPLPETGDTLQAVFSATVALQVLALKMSVKKRAYLEGLGVRGHGVDPDAPKNVSKSITVD